MTPLDEIENEYHPIPDFHWYEINLLGDVRYSDTKVEVPRTFTIQGGYYNLLSEEGLLSLMPAKLLIDAAFPESKK